MNRILIVAAAVLVFLAGAYTLYRAFEWLTYANVQWFIVGGVTLILGVILLIRHS